MVTIKGFIVWNSVHHEIVGEKLRGIQGDHSGFMITTFLWCMVTHKLIFMTFCLYLQTVLPTLMERIKQFIATSPPKPVFAVNSPSRPRQCSTSSSSTTKGPGVIVLAERSDTKLSINAMDAANSFDVDWKEVFVIDIIDKLLNLRHVHLSSFHSVLLYVALFHITVLFTLALITPLLLLA